MKYYVESASLKEVVDAKSELEACKKAILQKEKTTPNFGLGLIMQVDHRGFGIEDGQEYYTSTESVLQEMERKKLSKEELMKIDSKLEGFRYFDAEIKESHHSGDMLTEATVTMRRAVTASFEFDKETRDLTIGYAIRSPLDRNNRQRGRMIAVNRRKHMGRFTVKCRLKENATIKEAAMALFQHCRAKASEWFPRWTVNRKINGIRHTVNFMSYRIDKDGGKTLTYPGLVESCVQKDTDKFLVS